jgi:hydrophobic/amphiphilic exporter-1 (mainly G- bacteria), HAE1 family
MSLTEIAIKRPSLIIVIFATLALLGIFGYTNLKYELLPKMTPPVLSIITAYPGASPDEVEQTVSRKIEDAISGLEDIDLINTTSREGVSIVVLQMKNGADIEASLNDAQRKVNGILSTMPDEVKTPTIFKFALDEFPIIRAGFTAEKIESKAFYQLMKDQVQPRLSKIKGVGQVSLVGGNEREIRVNVNPEKLLAYNIPLTMVVGALSQSNLDFPTGSVKGIDNQYTVRLASKLVSLEEMGDLIISRGRSGGDVRLRDVAEVVDGQKEMANLNRINGTVAIGLNVQKQTDANAVEVAKEVKAEFEALMATYAYLGMKIDVAGDSSLFTISSANAVVDDLILAVCLVALVMLVFLHSLRSSIIVMMALPASIVSTFLAMFLLDFSLNLMTLLALSLVVGILVDDSIVVLENIFRHLEMGKDRKRAALDGRNEIGFTALAITMVDVVVFVPLSLVSGIIGNIMREFALVIVFSTLMSLFVSFTLTPLLASRFSSLVSLSAKNPWGRFGLWFEAGYRKFTRRYLELLRWALHGKLNKAIVVLATAGLFFWSVSLIPGGYVGTGFIKQADRGEFSVVIELASSTTIEKTALVSQDIERRLMKIPEVKKANASVGASGDGFLLPGVVSNNTSEIIVTLIPLKERSRSTEQVVTQVRKELNAIPGVKVKVKPIGILGTADEAPINFSVTGSNRTEVTKYAKLIQDEVATVPGLVELQSSLENAKAELRVEIDRQRLNNLGLNVSDVGTTLRTALVGYDQSKFREDATEYDIRVSLDKFDRSKVENIQGLALMNNRGQMVYLSQFATVYQTVGPTERERLNRNPSVNLQAQVLGRATGDVGADVKAKITALKLPPTISVEYIGQMRNQTDAFGQLGLAFLAGIIFEYLIMVALYDSFIYPFVVLFSIPVALVGAILALALSNSILDIFSILGIIMLVGLVGKNAILLVDFANHMRERGLPLLDSLIEAGRERLRPILMTTLTMIFGMLPIALASGDGAEWKNGLAWALVGGLTSSMILTLVFVPVIYYLVTRVIERFNRLISPRKPQVVAASTQPEAVFRNPDN